MSAQWCTCFISQFIWASFCRLIPFGCNGNFLIIVIERTKEWANDRANERTSDWACERHSLFSVSRFVVCIHYLFPLFPPAHFIIHSHFDCTLFLSLSLLSTTNWLGCLLAVSCWKSECQTKSESFTKWAWHHYMFNGMQLFVWPKKMEIRFACSAHRVSFTALDYT